MTLHSFWTDKRDTILRTIAANGGTAMEAYHACGAVSRNAVIGRANRLGVRFGQRGEVKLAAIQPTRLPSKPRPLPREELAKIEVEPPKPKSIIGRRWTEDEVAILADMAAKRASFTEVAKRLGRSRKAIESKASDCQIKFFRHDPPRPPKPIGNRSRAGRPVKFGTGGAVALVDLERHHCRYIPGDPRAGGAIYCGDRREPGSSFCPAHHALCYQPTEALRNASRCSITTVISRVLA